MAIIIEEIKHPDYDITLSVIQLDKDELQMHSKKEFIKIDWNESFQSNFTLQGLKNVGKWIYNQSKYIRSKYKNNGILKEV